MSQNIDVEWKYWR